VASTRSHTTKGTRIGDGAFPTSSRGKDTITFTTTTTKSNFLVQCGNHKTLDDTIVIINENGEPDHGVAMSIKKWATAEMKFLIEVTGANNKWKRRNKVPLV
jgi:hypothetical protein